MSILKEILLYGNLEVVYSQREIKKFNIVDLFEIFKIFSLSEGGIYRFFINYKSILNAKDTELIKENKPEAIYFLDIMKIIIEKAIELKVFDTYELNINMYNYNSIIKTFIYYLLILLENKIKTFILENEEINIYHKKYCEYFKDLLPTVRAEFLTINHIEPLENDKFWKPSWKIVYKNKDYFLEGADTFIDRTFLNYYIQCHSEVMFSELRYINQRIKFLKANASTYFYTYIRDLVEHLSKNIFENFPLQIVYRDYYNCMLDHPEFHRVKLINYIKLNEFNKEIFLLSILPKEISSYLLGYPILKAGIPSYKNISEKIKNFNSENYYEELAVNFNKKHLELISMGINCGNRINENGDYLDIFYNKVIDYNIDDIYQSYNNDAYHIFTIAEFEDLSKNGKNYYNNCKIKNSDHIIYSIRNKRKFKRKLRERNIDVELGSTLLENFKEIKNAIENQEIFKFNQQPERRLNLVGNDRIGSYLV
jgi:hypothetical protein